jgi:hypothetical protein
MVNDCVILQIAAIEEIMLVLLQNGLHRTSYGYQPCHFLSQSVMTSGLVICSGLLIDVSHA